MVTSIMPSRANCKAESILNSGSLWQIISFIDFRIFLYFNSTIYCLQSVKIPAPDSFLFHS